jgi:hypothetical protein
MIDPIEAADAIENKDPAEAIEPTDRNEPTDPIDSTERRQPMLKKESSDHSDHFELRAVAAGLTASMIQAGRGLRKAGVRSWRPDTLGEMEDCPRRVSADLERWLSADGEKTVDGLIAVFGRGSFALLFVLLLGVPALPLPTGGATHVMEIIAVLLALQLILGRREIWLPERWRRIELAGPRQQKFLDGLLKVIRFLERFSRPRLRFLFSHRLSDLVFGLLVLLLTVAAFVAPPFSGLDTLPSLAVVLLALAVLLEDALFVVLAALCGAAGIVLEVILGRAALNGVSGLF